MVGEDYYVISSSEDGEEMAQDDETAPFIISSSDETEEDEPALEISLGGGRGKGKVPAAKAGKARKTSSAKGVGRSLTLGGQKQKEKQGASLAAKPETPECGPSKRPRRKLPVPNMDLLESDRSSGSEFRASQESSSSDDDSSDDAYSNRMAMNSRARIRRATPDPPDDEDDEVEVDVVATPARGANPSGPGSRPHLALGKANGRGPKGGKRRGKGRGRAAAESEKKLQWEISDDEWEEKWGNATDADFEKLKASKFPVEVTDPPKELLMPLLPFQKEWLAWSTKQEAGPYKGGILADEMGMGKTIQAISLIVAARARKDAQSPSPPRPLAPPKLDLNLSLASSSDAPKPLPEVKATLVICPLVAVIQWRNEVARFTQPGSVKVLVYHGPRRNLELSELAKYDIVLSTYSIVELEHRKHVMPPKDVCQWCNRLFYTDRMKIHLRYFCGPNAQRTAKQAKQVKRKHTSNPSEEDLDDNVSSEDFGEEEVENMNDDPKGSSRKKGKGPAKGKGAKGKGKKAAPATATGGKRGRKPKIGKDELGDALEGAATFVNESFGKGSSSSTHKNSVLHSVRWGRIVLDEAHSIKDRRSSTAKAVFALQSEYKWALSGTPLQNRVGELYSLVRFLGIHPFSFYFCRKCECKSLEYQCASGPGEKCECGHSPLLHLCWWNKFVANPIKRWGYINEGRKAMMLLKHKVLGNILLRRTKLERAADLTLPPRTAFLRRDAFDDREEDFYQALYTQSQSQFNTYVSAGTLVNNYAHIFDLLTRLRQAVDHPYLVIYSATAIKEAPTFESAAADGLCGLCHESAEDPLTTACDHIFCRSCIQGYIDAAQDLKFPQCPKCQKPLTVDLTAKSDPAGASSAAPVRTYKRSSILNRIDLRQFQTSTKIEAVKEEISRMLQNDSAAKAIIFSQFTSMLDLIGYGLEKSDIKFVKLDGSMSMAARDHMIETFTNDADTKIFLMSLKAGGVALNLTVASHVFLMDPWWNPAVEQQAQDRIHRLGQYKPIRVIRFVIENTIEERILKLQEKKQLVFEGTVGGSSEALGRLTEEDLRFLFTS